MAGRSGARDHGNEPEEALQYIKWLPFKQRVSSICLCTLVVKHSIFDSIARLLSTA